MQTGTCHVHTVDLTFNLLDPGNSLHHANYLVLADRARGATLQDLGSPPHELWQDGYVLIVRGLCVDYCEPVFAGTELAIETTIEATSESSLEGVQRFFFAGDYLAGDYPEAVLADRPVCVIRAQLSCANMVKRRVDAIPQALLEALSASAVRQRTGEAA